MRPLSALIRTANAISGQITSFRLVMTELWTLTEVITGKSGCGKKKKRKKRKEKKRVRGSRVGRGWKRKKTEGDGTGWRSILIWSQKWVFFRAYNRVRRLNWLQCQTSRQVDVTQIEGWGWRGVLPPQSTFFWNLYRQVWYILDHTHKKKKNLMQEVRGSCSALWQRQRRMCDRGRSYRSWQHFSSVWNEEMDRQTKRRKEDTCLKLDRCQNLKGSRTVGRIWATDKSKLTHIEALKKKKSTFSKLFRVELYLIISSNM